jgi:hypothetical protein
MKLTAMELYVIYQSLDARKHWIEDDSENQEELPFLKSAIFKIKELGVELNLEPQKSDLSSGLSSPKKDVLPKQDVLIASGYLGLKP